MRPEERQLIARLAHRADPREPCYDKERPRDVAWSGYVSAGRHIDAGRVGEERLAYLIRQIAKVVLRNRRLEGAVVTDQRRVRCLLVQTSIVCSSSRTLTTPLLPGTARHSGRRIRGGVLSHRGVTSTLRNVRSCPRRRPDPRDRS